MTVPNTEAVRDFYQAVAGWTFEPVEMGDYALAADGPRAMGETVRMCVIQDPAGAVAALIEAG